MTAEIIPTNPGGEFLLYQTQDGRTRIQCRFAGETIWLTQQQMAELFQVDKSRISRHLKNIYEEGELSAEATVAFYATVRQEGERQVTRELEHYNLDAIISVGYRVNSLRGTQFRIWATQRLREYLVKGFALDDERLKAAGGGNYFDELLARIRDIRSSEKVFWRKVLDIYATSIDYDPKAEVSQEFFKVVQNKMHWASHGHTAAEIIAGRADANQPHMGMTNWPGDSIRRADVGIAKNYLQPQELEVLNRMVTAYLELAELQALNRQPMYMKDWVARLDDFLTMTGREILTHAGTVSHQQALEKARQEYERYQQRMLTEPSPVERHFIEAVEEVKQLEDRRKRLDEKGGK
ncbi:virulence RhuM family protein [Anaerobaca lacustris]|uniref:Virulence RhuM family protein n=1 Tax=Anaerobaca lacustris TaxID=3044600 RepID=A0AAW6U4K1_9BACT|nr:virulence RhuM family protein [Sedimentisphaerales bacterium M17dextr]